MHCKKIKEIRFVRNKGMICRERTKIRFLKNMLSNVDSKINKKVYPSFEMQLLSAEYKLKVLVNDS